MNLRDADGRVAFLMAATATVVVGPLIANGPSYGHDFNFHLLNWMEAARQFSHGTLYPRWAFSPAYNAGEPRFVFYPPASWTLGALIGLVLTHIPGLRPDAAWSAVPIVFTWICVMASGFSMYCAARTFASRRAAAFAATLYAVNPYMLFTTYERSAYAELLAAAWVPLLLRAVLAPEVKATRIAVPIALLWLTNAPAAVIGCYATLVLVIARLALPMLTPAHHAGDAVRKVAIPAGLGTLLGLGLASFYLIPAAWERQFVQVAMATLDGMRIDQNFLFEHTGNSVDAVTHDEVLHTASWIAVSLLVGACLSLLVCWWQQNMRPSAGRSNRLSLVPLLVCVVLVGFLLTPWSISIWQHTPELAFLQFPWRLLILVAPIFALSVSAAVSELRINRVVTGVVALAGALVLTFATYRPFHQVSDPDETVTASLRTFLQNAGAEPTDEYTPKNADNDKLSAGNPPYWLGASAKGPARMRTAPGQIPEHFTIETARAEFLILNLRDYPAWRILVNSRLEVERDHRDDGLIAFAVPAGRSRIDIRYARGFDSLAGAAVSLISLATLGAAWVRKPRQSALA